ncbi:hypothetical protein [Frigoribacterium sp. RIT-PI-h]|uniref:hypothetical protein n=1 Tax=Frigoribacterium sp. RIT-PI-h TaxID=1690245 RepID=UPI00128F40A3|nr:hypothetical protein [Frigoribacterium sp. RIT-PI-h]
MDSAKVRRRTRVGALVALAVAVFLVLGTVYWDIFDGPPVRDGVAIIFFSAAVACLVMAFVPAADPGTSPNPGKMLGDWRQSERVERQFAKHPPTIVPEDRDEVIAGSQRLLATSVIAVDRSKWVPCGYLLAWVALVVAGMASPDQLTLLLLPLIFSALYSATVLTSVTAAGRADAAHHRALSLPPTPADSSPVRTKSSPPVSRLALPDE